MRQNSLMKIARRATVAAGLAALSAYGGGAATDPAAGAQLEKTIVALFSPDAVKKTDELAARIELSKPLYILYLGDSLADHDRGSNFVDMVDFYLNRHNPGLGSSKNAAVGGDFVTRVWDRIEGARGGKPTYRQQAYDNLLDRKPDLVFIFLGANDSKVGIGADDSRAPTAENFTRPAVPPDKQYAAYNKLLDYLRTNTGARIAFISAVSSYWPPQLQKHRDLRALKKAHSLRMDEHIVNFNATLRKISAEREIAYIDVYTPTRNHPEKAKLFRADGVHISEEGNLLVAQAVLEYLGSVYPRRAASDRPPERRAE